MELIIDKWINGLNIELRVNGIGLLLISEIIQLNYYW